MQPTDFGTTITSIYFPDLKDRYINYGGNICDEFSSTIWIS